jgi:hypothetical protein
MSTASPDTCEDVSAVATQRAASSSEPYLVTASRRSRSWSARLRQPLLTTRATPSCAASSAARRRAARSSGSRFATAGTSSSKADAPSGAARAGAAGGAAGREAATEGAGSPVEAAVDASVW